MSLKRQKQLHNEQKFKRKTLLILLIVLTLILLPLCTAATYTWLSISRTPKVSDMEMTINSSPGLELAWAADAPEEAWGQQLDFTDAVGTDTLLTPVTWSQREQSFYTAEFGADGRVSSVGVRLSDEKDANGRDGHYVKFTLYGRTGQHVKVSLSQAVTLPDGSYGAGTYLIGTPLWQAEDLKHTDGGNGVQHAMRVGLKIAKISADGRVDPTPDFYVYEPNGDRHIDGSIGYVATPSTDETPTLVDEAFLIRQTTSRWEESDPVERDVVIREAGVFERDVDLFELEVDEKVRIDVYLWLEGMDVDCVNAIGVGAHILANLQLVADPYNGSGLVPVR